jgi:hypothetical protein
MLVHHLFRIGPKNIYRIYLNMEALHSFNCAFEKFGCSLCKKRGQRPKPFWAGPCFICRHPLLDIDNLIVKCGDCKQSYHAKCLGLSRDEAIARDFTVDCHKCTYDLPPGIWSIKQYLQMDTADQDFWERINVRIRRNQK